MTRPMRHGDSGRTSQAGDCAGRGLMIGAVVAILFAIAAIGWRAVGGMGRIEGTGSAMSSLVLFWAVVFLLLVGVATALLLTRRRGSAGTGNRRAATVAILASLVAVVLALVADPG